MIFLSAGTNSLPSHPATTLALKGPPMLRRHSSLPARLTAINMPLVLEMYDVPSRERVTKGLILPLAE
jgi:hypothetical protein